MNEQSGAGKIRAEVHEDIRDLVDRKLAVFDQIRALKAENRDLRDQILASGRINSAAIAVAVMCW